MKNKSTSQSVSLKLRVLIAFSVVLVSVFLALFAAANPFTGRDFRNASAASGALPPAQVTARTFMRVTPDGVVRDYNLRKSKGGALMARIPKRRVLGPLGNTLWRFDDDTAIADGVADRREQCVGRLDSQRCSPDNTCDHGQRYTSVGLFLLWQRQLRRRCLQGRGSRCLYGIECSGQRFSAAWLHV